MATHRYTNGRTLQAIVSLQEICISFILINFTLSLLLYMLTYISMEKSKQNISQLSSNLIITNTYRLHSTLSTVQVLEVTGKNKFSVRNAGSTYACNQLRLLGWSSLMSNTCTSVRHIDQLDKTNQPGTVLGICFAVFPHQHQEPKKRHCKHLSQRYI